MKGSYLIKNIKLVQDNIAKVIQTYQCQQAVRLVAVSKTKPMGDIQTLYDESGHRHFGENYVQELLEKAQALKEKCPEIRWHYIGHIQSNKIKLLNQIEQLYCVETVDRIKIAKLLNEGAKSNRKEPLKVMIQVNTSDEDQKGGTQGIEETIALAKFIKEQCEGLELLGLMTIGSTMHSHSDDEVNPDFEKLRDIRSNVAKSIGIKSEDLELSMGMSSDYDVAIKAGSTNVRVGSTIFGERNYA